MKKGPKILIISLSVILVAVLTLFLLYKNSKKELKITDQIEVNKDIKLKELLGNDIELLEDYKIDTTKLGEHEIEVKYKNKIFTYTDTIKVTIIDTEAPTLEVKNLKFEKGTTVDFSTEFSCTDNYDEKPNCYIEGTYNTNAVGTYNLKYIGEDSSNNKSEKDFTLEIFEKVPEIKKDLITCTQTQTMMGVNLNAVMTISLENEKFKYIDMKIDAILPEKYINQKATFVTSFEKSYADYEKKYGIKPLVSETDKGVRVTAYMTDEQARNFSGSTNMQTTRTEVINTFSKQGYSCN